MVLKESTGRLHQRAKGSGFPADRGKDFDKHRLRIIFISVAANTYNLIIRHVDDSGSPEVINAFAKAFSLPLDASKNILSSCPIIFTRDLSKSDYKAILRTLIELSKLGIEFKVTSNPGDISEVKWAQKPAIASGTLKAGQCTIATNQPTIACPNCGELFVVQRLNTPAQVTAESVESATEAEPEAQPIETSKSQIKPEIKSQSKPGNLVVKPEQKEEPAPEHEFEEINELDIEPVEDIKKVSKSDQRLEEPEIVLNETVSGSKQEAGELEEIEEIEEIAEELPGEPPAKTSGAKGQTKQTSKQEETEEISDISIDDIEELEEIVDEPVDKEPEAVEEVSTANIEEITSESIEDATEEVMELRLKKDSGSHKAVKGGDAEAIEDISFEEIDSGRGESSVPETEPSDAGRSSVNKDDAEEITIEEVGEEERREPAPAAKAEPSKITNTASSNSERYNVFVSSIKDPSKKKDLLEIICKYRNVQSSEATKIMKRLIIPIAKDLGKSEADELIGRLKKLNIVARKTKS